jgi:hypothetical protein
MLAASVSRSSTQLPSTGNLLEQSNQFLEGNSENLATLIRPTLLTNHMIAN